jgi:hypothetical protein
MHSKSSCSGRLRSFKREIEMSQFGYEDIVSIEGKDGEWKIVGVSRVPHISLLRCGFAG